MRRLLRRAFRDGCDGWHGDERLLRPRARQSPAPRLANVRRSAYTLRAREPAASGGAWPRGRAVAMPLRAADGTVRQGGGGTPNQGDGLLGEARGRAARRISNRFYC